MKDLKELIKALISVGRMLLPVAIFLGVCVYFVGVVETFWFVIVVALLYYARSYYDLNAQHNHLWEQLRKKRDS